MGLGLFTRAERRNKSIFDQPQSLIGQAELLDAFQSAVENTPLAPLAASAPRDDGADGFIFYLHPAEEPVFLELDGEHVILSAKTSSAGPGYHAFLISVLDDLEARLGLSWQWNEDGSDDEYVDETGYVNSRDFVELQHEMAAFVQGLFSFLTKEIQAKGGSNFRVSMPAEFDVENDDDETLTPLGPLSNEEIAKGDEVSEDVLQMTARSYFPWWEEGFGASFYRGLALNALWMLISWSSPADEDERDRMRQVLDWCEKAATLGANPPLPASAAEELHRLSVSQEPPRLPAKAGVGYRRRFIRRQLTGYWSISVPGALNELVGNGGETVTFWNSELEVRGSSLVADYEDDMSSPTHPGESELTRRTDYTPEESGEGYVLNSVAKQISDDNRLNVGIVTIWMTDESLRPVAEQIAASIELQTPHSE